MDEKCKADILDEKLTYNYWVYRLVSRKHNVLETDLVSKTLCFLVFRIMGDTQGPETQ
jgi:hypothetical protein